MKNDRMYPSLLCSYALGYASASARTLKCGPRLSTGEAGRDLVPTSDFSARRFLLTGVSSYRGFFVQGFLRARVSSYKQQQRNTFHHIASVVSVWIDTCDRRYGNATRG